MSHSCPRDCRWFALTNIAENTRLWCDVVCFSCEMHCFHNLWCFCQVCVSFCVCVGPKGCVYSEQGHFGSSEMGGMQDGGASDVLGVTEVLNDGSSK